MKGIPVEDNVKGFCAMTIEIDFVDEKYTNIQVQKNKRKYNTKYKVILKKRKCHPKKLFLVF